MVPLALGTQTKGSVLRPAAYCGAVGFKPTFGRISRRNVFPLAWSFDTMGFICRSVEDAALTLGALAGHDRADSSSLREPPSDYVAALQARWPAAPRLGIVRDYFDRAQPAVRDRVLAMTARLEGAGARLVELRLPMDFDLVNAIHDLIMHVEAAAVHRQSLAEHRQSYGPVLRQMLEAGALIPGLSYVQAQRLRRRFRVGMGGLLDQVDALLTPTASGVAPGRETTGDAAFQAPWTQLGLPAISLPAGVDADGLPLALQLASRPLDEASLLSVARWVEDLLDPLPAPPLS